MNSTDISLPDSGDSAGRKLGWWSVLSDVSLALGIAAVPAFSSQSLPILLGCVVVTALGTQGLAKAAVLVTYGLPVLIGAPWPVHCVVANCDVAPDRTWAEATGSEVVRHISPSARLPCRLLRCFS